MLILLRDRARGARELENLAHHTVSCVRNTVAANLCAVFSENTTFQREEEIFLREAKVLKKFSFAAFRIIEAESSVILMDHYGIIWWPDTNG